MKSILRALYFLAGLSLLPAIAQEAVSEPVPLPQAIPPTRPAETTPEAYMIKLLDYGCLPAITGGDTLDTFARTYHFRVLADWLTAELLRGVRGEGYDASGEHGQFMIAASRFSCFVYAQKMDALALQKQVAEWVTRALPGLTPQPAEVQSEGGAGAKTELITYNLTRVGGVLGAQVLLTTSQDPRAPMQAAVAIMVAP